MLKKTLPAIVITLCLVLAGCESEISTSGIKSIEDLSGKSVGIQTGTLYEDYLFEKNPDAVPEFYTDPNTMVVAVARGKLAAYITENAAFPHEQKAHPQLVCLEESIADTPVCVGIGKTEKQELLKTQLNEFIAECNKDGTLESMNEYWVENGDEDNNAADRSGITGENGKLIVGIEGNYVPFSYLNNGQPEGYDIDFVYRFCRKYGYEPVIEQMEYDALSPSLATGKCDIAMNILYDEEREEEVTLSDEYYMLQILVAYRGKGDLSVLSVDRIAESFNKTFIKDNRWKEFASGALVSIAISALSLIFGTLFGMLLYILCRKGKKTVNYVVDKISWLVEGTPAVLLLMIFYFIIFGSVDIEKTIVAIIAFTIVFTVSMFSMLKSGEAAVGPGQLEAALSQGFSELSAYIRIVLPQSAIHFLPQYCGEVVSLIKETSIVGYIAILDLTKISDMIRGRTFEPFFPLISTAIIYFIISWLLTVGVKRLYKAINPETRNLKRAFRDIKEDIK